MSLDRGKGRVLGLLGVVRKCVEQAAAGERKTKRNAQKVKRAAFHKSTRGGERKRARDPRAR